MEPEQLFDFDSYEDLASINSRIVGVRVNLEGFEWPKAHRSPRISRVDGNHRLYGVDQELSKAAEGDEDAHQSEFPPSTFALMIGLNVLAEARLFRDINGEHKGMDTAHLTSLDIRTRDPEELKADSRLRPTWLAHELAAPGRAFDGMVFMGGSHAGVKASQGQVPPVKISALRAAISQQLQSASFFATAFESAPDSMLAMIDNYWKAVRQVFSEAWTDRKNYILLQSIGLNGFARFGGHLLDKALQEEKFFEQDFVHYLLPVRDKCPLNRDAFIGIAGAGGAAEVSRRLNAACDSMRVLSERAKAKLQGPGPGLDEKLAQAAAKQGSKKN
jgi:hypothetical protein